MGCAEVYLGTASRSVEIMFVPPPKAAAKLAAALPPRTEKDLLRMETSVASEARPIRRAVKSAKHPGS
jgi:hypothetical protein